jgi:predicted DNA-binding transcriptional regulator YafY
MRANRLLSLMFLVQSKGRMTAEELAESLEVSKRTIYREIDALNLAGIPIYTQDGRNGGIYLDKHYRISLNSLGREEIQLLFMYATQGPIHDIGLNNAIENALLKLLAALPLRYREEAEQMRQRVHFDSSQWFYQRDVSQWMPMLLEAVFEERKLWLQYLKGNGIFSEKIICPYGVVAKLDIWYLVALTDEGEMRTFRVSRFKSLRVLEETFERSPTFDLTTYWKESTHHFTESKPRYILNLRVAPDNPGIIRYMQEAYGGQAHTPDPQGWTPVTLSLSAMQEARMVVMAMGDRVEIIDPPELREEVRQWLNLLLEHYNK